MAQKEKVLIVGGGFGGVKSALELSKSPDFEVTLLSADTDLRYYPTLYHTATGGARANSSIPLRIIFLGRPVELITGEAKTLDKKAKTLTTAEGQTFSYDTLVLALGVVTNYFNIPGLSDYAYSIKSQEEVQRFKKHLHDQITSEHKPDLNYVVVGAGPTGIELAGSLPSYLKHVMTSHGLSERKVHVDLIEAAPSLLPRLPKDVSRAVGRQLKKIGVRLYTGSAVQGESADELTVNGKPIRSHTVVWTAGVTNHPFFKENNFVITNHGKVAVNTYLQAEDDIFVIGDNANTPYSGMAQTAILDGDFVAHNLKRKKASKDFKSYIAHKPITVIPAGPHWAAVLWERVHIYGRTGWLLREAADLEGFHDFEPWKMAIKQFTTEFIQQDSCEVCAAANAN